MSSPKLQTIGGKDTYKYNTTQTTQYEMNPPILQTTGGKNPYKYNTIRNEPSYTTNNRRERPVQVQHNTNNTIQHEPSYTTNNTI
jgi:hypothetical protein